MIDPRRSFIPIFGATILWDIDGTLVDVRGAGRRAFISALEKAWGVVDDLKDVSFAGGTDLGVLDQLRTRLHLPHEHTALFFDAMSHALAYELHTHTPIAYAGARTAIAWFADRGAHQGLLTGNEERCAWIKLENAGISRTHFAFGAYGHEHADRNELARRAHTRARRHAEGEVIVIGDTPRDIEAARAIGAIAIAVATGHAARAQLEEADVVLDDLTSLSALFS